MIRDMFPETITESTGDRDSWATPPEVFRALDEEFHFVLDPCAEPWSAKCQYFYTRKQNGLVLPWFGVVFLNPPYSDVGPWLDKAVDELHRGIAERVVALIPAAVTVGWWHKWVEPYASQLRFPRGRIQFLPPPGIKPSSNDSDNAIVVYERSRCYLTPRVWR